MSFDLPFRVMFRGIEVGRYASAETATAAARSVIDVELGSRSGAAGVPAIEPGDLPLILWQPPEQVVAFDAQGYWHAQAQSLARYTPPAPSTATPVRPPEQPPYPEPDRPILPRGPVQPGYLPPAPVYGGPPIAPGAKPRGRFPWGRK